MSRNIHIFANGVVISPNGNNMQFSKSFNCWQTPSKITDKILGSDDAILSYIKWAEECYESHQEEVEEWSEEKKDYVIIGSKTVYPAKEHIEELNIFIQGWKDLGFGISVEGW